MKVLKYATGQEVPKGAKYLCTIKNGVMHGKGLGYEYVWHYFLVEENFKEHLHLIGLGDCPCECHKRGLWYCDKCDTEYKINKLINKNE